MSDGTPECYRPAREATGHATIATVAPTRPALRRSARRLGRCPVGLATFRLIDRMPLRRDRPRRALAELSYRLAPYRPMEPAQRAASVHHTESLFLELVERLQPDTMIEAGAKDGGIAARVKAARPATRVVAFEANPYTFRRFAERHADGASGVDYRNVALSDRSGDVTFHVNVRPDGRPSADGQGSLLTRVPDHARPTAEVGVSATSLDECFEPAGNVSFALWIDVEGATRPLLRGGAAVLHRTAVLIVEVEERSIWGGQATRADVVDVLSRHGLVPVARDFQSRYQFNLVFVRRELAGSPEMRAVLRAAGEPAATA